MSHEGDSMLSQAKWLALSMTPTITIERRIHESFAFVNELLRWQGVMKRVITLLTAHTRIIMTHACTNHLMTHDWCVRHKSSNDACTSQLITHTPLIQWRIHVSCVVWRSRYVGREWRNKSFRWRRSCNPNGCHCTDLLVHFDDDAVIQVTVACITASVIDAPCLFHVRGWWGSLFHVTWLVLRCDMTHWRVDVTWLIHVCDTRNSFADVQ